MQTKLGRFWPYIILALWGVGAYLLTRFLPPMPLGLMVAVGFMIFAPGFALGRLWRLDLESTLDKTIASLTLGFIYTWLLGFAAILLGLNINILSIVWLVLLAGLFMAALIIDIRRATKTDDIKLLRLKDIFSVNNLIYLLVFAAAFLIIMYLVRIGSLFKGGDANYHLATLRKVIGGEPLTVHNLNYARDKMMIVYGFPVWHIFLGLVAKLAHSDIFIVWRDISAALLGLAMLVWYWLSRKVLPTRNLAILAFIIFAFFGFYWGPAYVYSTFGIPHTFSQLLLLPLAAGLVLTYVFDRPDKKLLLLILALMLTGTAVHITFYFYLLTILLSFLICYAAICWRRPDYWATIKRLFTLIGLQILIVVPLAIGLEFKGHAVSNYFKIFQDPSYPTNVGYKSISGFNAYSLYAYIFLPLILLFCRRAPKLILPFAALLAIPLIYFTPIRIILARSIGLVYLNRLYGSLDWSFLIWAVVLGFVLVLMDRLIERLAKLKNVYRIGIDIGLAVVAGLLYYWQEQTRWAKDFWKTVFDGQFSSWVEKVYFWPLIIFIILGVTIFIWQILRPKLSEFFEFNKTKSKLAHFFLVSIIILVMAAPDWKIFKTYLLEKNGPEYFWRAMDAGGKAKAESYAAVLGGTEVVDFINQHIPPKSVFDTNSGYFYLPIMVDQHMPTYYSGAAKEHIELYDDDITLKKRLEILHQNKIDYLLVKPPKKGVIPFDQYPQYFTKIFPASAADGDGEHVIYQLNKPAINNDYPEYCPPAKEKKFKDYVL